MLNQFNVVYNSWEPKSVFFTVTFPVTVTATVSVLFYSRTKPSVQLIVIMLPLNFLHEQLVQVYFNFVT